ncbi:hypothetical protein ACWEO1_38115 [Kitasatospora cineracea]
MTTTVTPVPEDAAGRKLTPAEADGILAENFAPGGPADSRRISGRRRSACIGGAEEGIHAEHR